MSHHLSAPNLTSPLGDARLDMTDLFVFPAAEAPDRTVLVLDVNPFAPTQGEAFHPDAVYQIQIDTDGDNRADLAYKFTFTAPVNGAQTATVRHATGADARSLDALGPVIAEDIPVSLGAAAQVAEAGVYRIFAGMRSDPFFADLDGIVKGFQWTGVDFGAGKNVFAMAVEVPDADLGHHPAIGIWGRVAVPRDGALVSVDRGAHPSLTAYFNAEDKKEQYNAGEPADDWDTYREAWSAVLNHTGGYSLEAAEMVLRVVLPDVLRYDRSRPAMYPNGRTLTDDVTSARLSMLTRGKVATDFIGPHTDLLTEFPYLGTPHAVTAVSAV